MKKYILEVLLLIFISLNAGTTLAVMELKGLGITSNVTAILTNSLISELSCFEGYIILERDQMQTILEEQGLQNSGLCDDNECLVEIGGLLGAQKMVTGSIGKLGKKYSLSLRIFDVQTAKSDNSVTVNKKCNEEQLIDLLKDAVKELTDGIVRKKKVILEEDYSKKMQELKKYEQSVIRIEENANNARIQRVSQNISGTVAASCAAYYSDYGVRDEKIMKKIIETKRDYGESVKISNKHEINIPEGYKVKISQNEVITTNKNGTSASVRWR
jgi:hypothetical protein